MTKTTPDELIDEIGDNFNMFLKAGIIDSFSKKIDPELNINNLTKLLRIHFVLTDEVIDFVQALPQRVRRIKTTVDKRSQILNGEVRGRIEWDKTIKERGKCNYSDSTLFVCNQTEKNYNISENIVLKRLLSVIHSIIFEDLKPAIDKDYTWIKEWTEQKKLKTTLKEVFIRNIYIKRITSDDTEITERMIHSASKSRNKLYKDAAKLLLRYNKIMKHDLDPKEAKELLINTFIKPERTEVLFELYWVIKMIEAKSMKELKDIKFNLIDGANNIVAEWDDGDHIYRIYHDSTGSFQFLENRKDVSDDIEFLDRDGYKDGYLIREGMIFKEWQDRCSEIFSLKKGDSFWGGRPDILLEKRKKDSTKPEHVTIGEVKYTESKEYAAQGLKELLEYMALIKIDSGYFEERGKIFKHGEKVKGYLFVDKIGDVEPPANSNVNIVRFGDPMTRESAPSPSFIYNPSPQPKTQPQ
ncbi:MAG: hypothetical protein DRP47_09980 [Candidatus Zixiibacteriota bacterium]|nr:MAG: hypothetical protein DRP47_09980 [candidate division Zixibacteria bacterium]